jgi:hypothetical protein
MRTQPLFGGSMVCDCPVSFIDISELRAVPDSQEVFADMHSDQSIIIEILEQPDTNDVPIEGHGDEEGRIVTYYYRELAETNDALNNYSIEDILPVNGTYIPQLADTAPQAKNSTGWICMGEQDIYKFKETNPEAKNKVRIYMGLVRLPVIHTDILITMNVPMIIGRASSSALRGLLGIEQQKVQAIASSTASSSSSSSGMVIEPNTNSGSNDQTGSSSSSSTVPAPVDPYVTATNSFLHILKSFRIEDWSVFGE